VLLNISDDEKARLTSHLQIYKEQGVARDNFAPVRTALCRFPTRAAFPFRKRTDTPALDHNTSSILVPILRACSSPRATLLFSLFSLARICAFRAYSALHICACILWCISGILCSDTRCSGTPSPLFLIKTKICMVISDALGSIPDPRCDLISCSQILFSFRILFFE